MNGEQLKQAREATHATKRNFAEWVGVSQYRLDQLEKGKDVPTQDEQDRIDKVVRGARFTWKEGDVVILERGPEPEDGRSTRSEEWNGLSRGDLVQVTGLTGRFRFLFHADDGEHEPYVEVYGPIGRKKNSLLRSIRPDRIKITKTKKTR